MIKSASKFRTITATVFVFSFISLSFVYAPIANCLISFKGANGLKAAKQDRLPDDIEKFWPVQTEAGEVMVSRVDGYRVLYNNNKNVPFVNLKVELSKDGEYEADQKKILNNWNYLNSHSEGMESGKLIELNFNGFKIWGLSRNNIERGSTLGTFVMFPGNGISVYFYFNNLKPEYRNFKDLEDYKSQRNQFIGDYTKYLAGCKY